MYTCKSLLHNDVPDDNGDHLNKEDTFLSAISLAKAKQAASMYIQMLYSTSDYGACNTRSTGTAKYEHT